MTDLKPSLNRKQPNLFTFIEDVPSGVGTYFGRTYILSGEHVSKVRYLDYVKVDGKILKFKRSGITDGYYGTFFYVAFEEQI
jgi:hypothetical protein